MQSLISKIDGVTRVSIDLDKAEATIEMNKHVPTTTLQAALKRFSEV